jgi:hypothetical protein
MNGVVSWVGTWLVMILLLLFLAKTSWGKPIVYGLIWLAVLLLLVTHADELTSFFNVNALRLNG